MSNLVTIMNLAADDFEKDGLTFDQITVGVIRDSILALASAMLQTSFEQGNSAAITISTEFIGGLLESVTWLNDRLEVSRIDATA